MSDSPHAVPPVPALAAQRVILQPRRAQPFFGRHPWVYPGAIAAVVGAPADGAVVDLVSHAGNFVARGLYNAQSKLRVRLYSWDASVPLDAAFWRARLSAALRWRRQTLGFTAPDAACRLVFSEGDFLSGLIVDQFAGWLVVQFTSLGLAQRQDELVAALVDLVQPQGIYLRTEKGIGQLEGVELHDGLIWGAAPPTELTIREAGLRYAVDLREGQKTGFYLDQRDNRQTVARYAPGRRVLDVFCYSGGFGLHAARAGATSVLGVDGSATALALAQQNATLNGLTNVRFQKADAFAHLAELVEQQQQFDLVVLDPPKFARTRAAVPEALRGYRRLHSLALRLLAPDGILVSCCCSGLITPEELEELLAQTAVDERRSVQMIERRGQAADHPISAVCRESSYLKCIISRAL
jgi:23S rRNA (cytosine1962-C5)-methyltransferase